MDILKNITDEELIERYKGGDTESLDYLFIRYKSMVSSIARSYFLEGGSDEDLVQEGMIGLHKAVVSFDLGKNVKFHMFAKTCIKRAILDALKVATRDKHKALNDSVSLQDVDPDTEQGASPEDTVIDNERHDALMEKINATLTETQQTLLTYFLDGYSYSEIATAMGKDVKYVDNALQKIKNKIKKVVS